MERLEITLIPKDEEGVITVIITDPRGKVIASCNQTSRRGVISYIETQLNHYLDERSDNIHEKRDNKPEGEAPR